VWGDVHRAIHSIEGLDDTQVAEPGAEAAGLIIRLKLLSATLMKIEFACPFFLEPMVSGCPFQSRRVQESAVFLINNYFLVVDPYNYTI
jgi:hypothetical protein